MPYKGNGKPSADFVKWPNTELEVGQIHPYFPQKLDPTLLGIKLIRFMLNMNQSHSQILPESKQSFTCGPKPSSLRPPPLSFQLSRHHFSLHGGGDLSRNYFPTGVRYSDNILTPYVLSSLILLHSMYNSPLTPKS